MTEENFDQKQGTKPNDDAKLNEDAPHGASSSALTANTAAGDEASSAGGSCKAEALAANTAANAAVDDCDATEVLGAGGAAAAEDSAVDGARSAAADKTARIANSAAAVGAMAESPDAITDAAAGKKRSVAGIAVCMAAALVLCVVAVAYALGAIGGNDSDASADAPVSAAASADEESAEASASASEGEAAKSDEAQAESASADAPEGEGAASADQPATDGSSAGAANGGAEEPGAAGSPAASEPAADASTGGASQTEQQPAAKPATITVSVYIDSSRAAAVNGRYPSCMASTSVTLQQGATVYDALCATGVGVSGSSYYVSAINGLAEKLSGYPNSGWMYSVNGVFPQYACGRYVLQGGENIRWAYTLDLGKDL